MKDETIQSLRQIIDYLKELETQHYEESTKTEREKHILNDVLKIEAWLDNSDIIKCPHCLSLEYAKREGDIKQCEECEGYF